MLTYSVICLPTQFQRGGNSLVVITPTSLDRSWLLNCSSFLLVLIHGIDVSCPQVVVTLFMLPEISEAGPPYRTVELGDLQFSPSVATDG